MKTFFYTLTALLFLNFAANAQVVTILDFETADTSADFEYFASPTLGGTLTSTVANPDPSGINTSANVLAFQKAGDGDPWEGAFANTTIPIDVINPGQVCLKVWSDQVSSVSLKFENSTTGGGNWIQTQTIPTMNEWVELCFDTGENSIEDPMVPSQGHIYSTVVLFMDFLGAAESSLTYIDDLIVDTMEDNTAYATTFNVDMSSYAGTFDQVFVRGTFNGWSEDNTMTDNGNGIWSETIDLTSGSYEYKFYVNDGAGVWEEFNGTEDCVVTANGYTNRSLVVAGSDIALGTVCFNSCFGCADASSITWSVNMNNEDVSDEGVYIAGGVAFGVTGSGDFPLTDPDGDGYYDLTVERPVGFESDYTILNGLCPDWSCKEDIAGQSCAIAPYNDRHVGPIDGDVTILTCFGVCSENGLCDPNGIIEDELLNNIEVYPTMVSDKINININSIDRKAMDIKIVNANGQTVHTIINAHLKSNIQLDFAKYPSGIYFATFIVDNTIVTEKFIKK